MPIAYCSRKFEGEEGKSARNQYRNVLRSAESSPGNAIQYLLQLPLLRSALPSRRSIGFPCLPPPSFRAEHRSTSTSSILLLDSLDLSRTERRPNEEEEEKKKKEEEEKEVVVVVVVASLFFFSSAEPFSSPRYISNLSPIFPFARSSRSWRDSIPFPFIFIFFSFFLS